MDIEFIKMEILEVGLLVLAAYIGGKLARRLGIGEVIGQILGGMLVGPHFLELVHRFLEARPHWEQIGILQPVYRFFEHGFEEYAEIMEGSHFFVFLFLGIVAFSIGEELHRGRLKALGIGPVIVAVIQALLTWIVIGFGFYFVFGFDLIISLLIGSIGIATAPALSFILMSKLKIEGRLRNVLANVVVLDDIIEVVFFSTILAIALSRQEAGHLPPWEVAGEVSLEILLACVVGFGIFLALRFLIQAQGKWRETAAAAEESATGGEGSTGSTGDTEARKESESSEEEGESEGFLSTVLSDHPTPSIEILFIIFGVVSIGLAFSLHFHLPFLITAVVAGMLISNFHSHAIFDSLKLRDVMPLFNLLFFAIIGASVRLETFNGETLLFVLGYVVMRTAAKLFGTWFGCKITGQDPKITASLPTLMLPQAGMAAVETILVARVLAESGGEIVFNTIVPAIVIFELSGAYLSERTLLKWKGWVTGEKEALEASQAETSDGKLRMSDLMGDRAIQMVARSKDDAIFELVRTLAQKNIIEDTTTVLNAVREREQLATTAGGNGVAFPHCRSSAVDRPVAVCGIAAEKIEWSEGAAPVDLVFLIVSPAEDPEQHLTALRTIATSLRKRDIRAELKQALDRNEVVRFFRGLNETAGGDGTGGDAAAGTS